MRSARAPELTVGKAIFLRSERQESPGRDEEAQVQGRKEEVAGLQWRGSYFVREDPRNTIGERALQEDRKQWVSFKLSVLLRRFSREVNAPCVEDSGKAICFERFGGQAP